LSVGTPADGRHVRSAGKGVCFGIIAEEEGRRKKKKRKENCSKHNTEQ